MLEIFKLTKNSSCRAGRHYPKMIMVLILLTALCIPAFAHYSVSPSSTTNGGGTWGSILRMNGSINGNNVTFTVTKTSGTFSKTNSVYLKVGTYESYGVNRATGTIPAGGYQWSHTHDLSAYSYPKEFYFRVESTDGYAWVGPITVNFTNSNPYNPTVLSEPSSGSVGQSLNYSYRLSDPNSDRVKIQVSWGDGSGTWDSGLVSSGSTVSRSHSYGAPGIYDLYNTVFDEHGAPSSTRHVQVNISESTPAAPSTPSVTATGATSIYISWSSVSGAAKYTVWRSTSASGTYKQIYCSSPTNYTDSGTHLSPGTTYYYKIRAGNNTADCANSNSAGWSGYSSYTSATTHSSTPAAPSKPSVSATGPTSVYINWNSVSGAAKYTVWRSTSASGTYKQIYCSSPTNYTDSGSHLSPNTTYYYKIRAGNNAADCSNSNSAGWSGYSSYASVKTPSSTIPTPSKPSVTATGPTSVYINWSSVSGATKYTVRRSTSAYGTYKQIYCSSPTNYTDSGSHLSPGTTYYYKIRAGNNAADCADANSAGWSDYSNYASVKTPSITPATPSKPTVTATGPTSIYINWSPVNGAVKYTVRRSTSASGTYKQIYCSSPTNYTDSGSHLSPNTTYYYKIRAGSNSADCADANSAGWSGDSSYASAKTLDSGSCSVPIINSVSPSEVTAGSGAGSVIIEGSNFEGCETGYPKAFIGNLKNPTTNILSPTRIQIDYTSVNNTNGYQQVVVKNSSEGQYQTERYDVFQIKEQTPGSNSPYPKTCIISTDSSEDPSCKYAGSENAFKGYLIGECTWYAYGRVQELVDGGYFAKAVGIWFHDIFWDETGRHAKNWDDMLGGKWFSTSSNNYLEKEKRKAGLLVVWEGGENGHVAFVEEVKEDKSEYRASDFNLKKRHNYQDQKWRSFEKMDSDLGAYPKFLDLTLIKDDPEIVEPKDGKTGVSSMVTFRWDYNNPSDKILKVLFTLKKAAGNGGAVGEVICNRKDIGKTTNFSSYNIGGLKKDQWYKWWVELNFNDGSEPTGAGGYFKTGESSGGYPGTPKIHLNRTTFNFGATTSGVTTSDETLVITNSGSGTLNWNAAGSSPWINLSPGSGTGSEAVKISVNPTSLSAGIYNGSITVTDPNADNSPQTVQVKLNVYRTGGSASPFGEMATPESYSTVRSSVPVTGWALDDIGIDRVKIYNESTYIGDALLVEGARSDIEAAYPGYPMNHKAGWGYMLLTNFLPGGGNGTYVIRAKAKDKEGNIVTIGRHTIYCDNAHAVKPFGAIDTPASGGTASGGEFKNWGWALTPLPNKIPTNGSTIDVYVDGVKLGHPTYNMSRRDIASLFPGYANSTGPAGRYILDTTAYENGLHTIQWTAVDNAGNADGIGSRFFTIQNTGNARTANKTLSASQSENTNIKSKNQLDYHRVHQIAHIPVDCFEPLLFKTGYDKDTSFETSYPDEKDTANIPIREDERLVIHLNGLTDCEYTGYQVIGEHLKPLPIGSTIDSYNGMFYWQPGPGFVGDYEFVFIIQEPFGTMTKKKARVTIHPKF